MFLRLTTLCLSLVLLLPAAAQAQLFEFEDSFGSGVQGNGRFANAASVATDDGGRVYVADPVAGTLEVYDNARRNNRFLRTIGAGLLQRPSGVTIDNRGRIYVSDLGRDKAVMFDSFTDGNPVRREFGGPGTAIGSMSSPRHLVTDRTGVVYLVERGNARVQWFKPSGGEQVPVAAFGTAEPNTMVDPEGLERDIFGRFYVSDDNQTDGEIRVYDGRGFLLRGIGSPGGQPGQLSNPRGIAHDPFGRLLVADAGNDRVQLFASLSGGAGVLAMYGLPGSGAGRFDAPSDVALGPGAMLYVADSGNGRIVRLRYDDADRDGALDPRDNCAGLSNPDQRNTDRDPQGDDCDADDDNDGIADASDRCQRTRRGADTNRDGCGDPASRISAPRDGKTYRRRRPPTRIVGRATADELGVAQVQVAIARVRGRRCAWYSGRRFARAASCQTPKFINATGLQRWEAKVRIRGRGRYRIISRAVQNGGVAETALTKRNTHTFRVR